MSPTSFLASPSGPTSEISNTTTLSHWQYELVLYALVVGFFTLFASGVYTLSTRSEISKKYRASSVTSCLITFVAALAYLALLLTWLIRFKANAGATTYSPSPGTIVTGLRFADWSVTVPLLVVELFAVCNLAGRQAARMRFAGMAAAFLMILTGLFGVISVGQNNASNTELIIWGAISTVFFLALYPIMLRPVMATVKQVSAPTGMSLRNAAFLLLSVWIVYPLVYCIFGFTNTGDAGWAITIQLVFTAADIVAKAGYGSLIHKTAKLRTAEDAGSLDAQVPDTYPASVSIDGVPISVPGRAFTPDGRELVAIGVRDGHRDGYQDGASSREAGSGRDPRSESGAYAGDGYSGGAHERGSHEVSDRPEPGVAGLRGDAPGGRPDYPDSPRPER